MLDGRLEKAILVKSIGDKCSVSNLLDCGRRVLPPPDIVSEIVKLIAHKMMFHIVRSRGILMLNDIKYNLLKNECPCKATWPGTLNFRVVRKNENYYTKIRYNSMHFFCMTDQKENLDIGDAN